VADGASGLAIIDVSDPANPGAPVYRGTTGSAVGVTVSGSYACVANGESGLAIIDVSDPANPGAPVYRDTDGYARGVTASGSYAYVADHGSGLAISDISDPANPGAPVYRDSTDTRLDIYCADGTGTINTEIYFDTVPLLLEQGVELNGSVGSWRWYCINWTGTTDCGSSGAGDDESDGVFVYRNGVWQSSDRTETDGLGTYLLDRDVAAYIGNIYDGSAGFPGTFDEVRVSTVTRTPGWIEAQYRSMTDTYLNYATEVIVERRGPLPCTGHEDGSGQWPQPARPPNLPDRTGPLAQ
jgi:hypothetical protein